MTAAARPRRSKKDLARISRFFQPWPGWVVPVGLVSAVLLVLSADVEDDSATAFGSFCIPM